MKSQTKQKLAWAGRLQEAKQLKIDHGKFTSDAELAESVSVILKRDGGKSVARPTVNAWINGTRNPPINCLLALCEALNVDPVYVLFGINQENKKQPTQLPAHKYPASIEKIANAALDLSIEGRSALFGSAITLKEFYPINKQTTSSQ